MFSLNVTWNLADYTTRSDGVEERRETKSREHGRVVLRGRREIVLHCVMEPEYVYSAGEYLCETDDLSIASTDLL